jgi:flagellar hook assembly protein FlgD
MRTASVTAKPKVFALKQNYPNPFNPATTIEYALPEAASVRLEVYNTLAQVVATLVAEEQTSGRYSVRWDGLNSNGELVGSGVYFYRLVAGDFQDIKRMLLIK